MADMVIEKQKPYRSKMFLAFCHEQMRGEMCCVCAEKPWTQLHHWGDDGGMALKPGDLEVARVCTKCHQSAGYKKKALILRRSGVTAEIANRLLKVFYYDALKLQSAYIQHLEGKRQVTGCARDELMNKIGDGHKWTILPAYLQADWLMAWADRRAAELFDQIDEP